MMAPKRILSAANAARRAARAANPEQDRRRCAAWARANPEKVTARIRRWQLLNPKRYAAQNSRYKANARARKASGEQFHLAAGRSLSAAYCGAGISRLIYEYQKKIQAHHRQW